MKTIVIFLILQLFSVSWTNAVAQNNKTLVLHSDKQKIPADGKTLYTSQLQQAIDRIAKKGWGTLVLTPGTYLSGSIFLKFGVTLKLEKGAVLLGSPNIVNAYETILVTETFKAALSFDMTGVDFVRRSLFHFDKTV